MRKGTDKAFHLAVTILALIITCASGMTILLHRDPKVATTWLPFFADSTTRTGSDDHANLRANHEVSKYASGRKVVKSEAQFTQGNSNVPVLACGSDVPQSSLQMVRNALSGAMRTITKVTKVEFTRPVYIYLAQTAAEYKAKLASLDVSNKSLGNLVTDTGGFTQGNHIVIALYQSRAAWELQNTVAHEMTHAVLNMEYGNIPSWVNEGLAVYIGNLVQQQAEPALQYQADVRRTIQALLKSLPGGAVHLPLISDEQQLLNGEVSYDVETYDWMAISRLVRDDGVTSVQEFLGDLGKGMTESQAFRSAFHTSQSSFQTTMEDSLTQIQQGKDLGVRITLRFPAHYRGYVRVLQHGLQVWKGFYVDSGGTGKDVSFSVNPNGELLGQRAARPTVDDNPPDDHTLYINLDPVTSFRINGGEVQDCGFAIDYHAGMYSFINGWVTDMTGDSHYFRKPTLFGVSVTQVKEISQMSQLSTMFVSH